jgi:hypothetical protein
MVILIADLEVADLQQLTKASTDMVDQAETVNYTITEMAKVSPTFL